MPAVPPAAYRFDPMSFSQPSTLPLAYGLRANRGQILQLMLQVLFVGMTLGMMRNVVPALAETQFGVPRGSFLMLVAFVVAFGLVKGVMNFVAGRMAELLGRRFVLLLGWSVALPIPLTILLAPTWGWIVFATVLLGISQGLTWSMTQTAKLDLAGASQRGTAIGLNEFAGYVGVAVAAIVTGYAASYWNARTGLMVFGSVVTLLAITLAWLAVAETQPWADAEAGATPADPGSALSTADIFALMSWRDRRLAALSQAGLVEKFVDALVWVFWPVYLHQRGVSLSGIGWIVGVYGFVWGGAQLFSGRLSDRYGRHRLNVAGMWICGAGVALLPLGAGTAWWITAAAISGLGMAMLYPNLSAAVADLAHPGWRASAIGIYRFWRDLGYGVGALGLGLAASWNGRIEHGFWFVAIAMGLSGAVLAIWGEESHPRLRAATGRA